MSLLLIALHIHMYIASVLNTQLRDIRMKTKKEERFDNIVGTILFLLMMGSPLVLLLLGYGESSAPLSKY